MTVDAVYRSDSCDRSHTMQHHYNEDNGCSQECIVSVTMNGIEKRSSSIIIAEDLISGRKVRCEVYVDKISRIEIETTSRRMYHDDIEEIGVLAFDSIGNLFSTLEGLQFQWSIVSVNKNTATPALKVVPFRESSIEVSDILLEMEKQDKESYSILVKGVESGKVYVNSRLIELGYSSVEQSSVMISVLEFQRLELHPQYPVYLAPGTMIQYELHTYKNDFTRTIPMPNSQFSWISSQSNVATVDTSGLVYASKLGSTDIIVQYEDMDENNAEAFVTVVWPARLQLKITPVTEEGTTGNLGTNWYLINSRQYILTVEVYDAMSHKIITSPDMEFVVDLPSDSFYVTNHNKNHAQHTITTRREGLTEISARLIHLIDSKTRQKIQLPDPLLVRQEVVISPNVIVTPSQLRFPYDTTQQHQQQQMQMINYHTYQLKAQGGTKEYNWFSNDNTISIVDSRGKVSSMNKKGNTKIIASDIKNPSNRGGCDISILPVHSIKIIPLQREAFIGEEIIIPIAFYDENGNLFDNCTSLGFKWSINDPSIFSGIPTNFNYDNLSIEKQKIIKNACTFRSIHALREGHTGISITFENLKTEMTFFAYDKLKIKPESVLVSLGSSYLYEIQGGPSPWYFEPSTYHASLIAEKNNHQIHVEKLRANNGRINFRVTCLEYGEQKLQIKTGNSATSSNPFPVESVSTTIFSCYSPSSLFIHPIDDSNENNNNNNNNELPSSKCDKSYFWKTQTSDDFSSLPSTFSLKNNKNIIFKVSLLDYKGNKFNNFSSIEFQWKSTNSSIAKIESTLSSNIELSSSQKLISLSDKLGFSNIISEIIGYDTNLLWKLSIRSDLNKLEKLKKEITIQSIENVYLSPKNQILFYHPDNIGYVDILGGSPVTGISTNDSKIISLQNSKEKVNRIDIIPKNVGNIQLSINDKCLIGSEINHAYIQISKISKISIEVTNAIPVGDSVELLLHIYDEYGNLFDPSQYKYMSLQYHQENQFIDIQPYYIRSFSSSTPPTLIPNKFEIFGVSPGSSSFSFFSNEYKVSSETYIIYVYPPFSIYPDELILSPSIEYTLQTYGGPPSGLSISFSSSKNSIASVYSDGTIKANSVGSCKIYAQAEGFDSVSGKSILYGSSETMVTVRDISDIQIQHPSNILLVGSSMNIFILGMHGESPFSYGSNLIFDWTQSNPDVLQLLPRYSLSNCSLHEEHMFSSTIKALHPGKSRISVKTQIKQSSLLTTKETYLESSILIHVIDQLSLITPNPLLITPGSSYKIQTNLDYLSNLQYSVISNHCNTNTNNNNNQYNPSASGSASSSSIYNSCSVNDHGEIFTSSRTGICFIHIHEPDSSQSIILQVEIKPIDAIQINPMNLNYPVQLILPLSEYMEFEINYLDDISREFHHVHLNDEFSITTNTQDIISYKIFPSEQRILVQGLKPGSTIIRVTRETSNYSSQSLTSYGTKLEDYISLRIGNSILPKTSTIHIGSKINYQLRFNNNHDKENNNFGANYHHHNDEIIKTGGSWKSSDSRVIKIHSESGKASALHTGHSIISFVSNDGYEISTSTEVIQIDEIESSLFDREKYLTNFNTQKSKPIKIPLEFYHESKLFSLNSSSPLISNDLSLSCSILPSIWGSARGILQDNEAFCLITLTDIKSIHLNNQIIPELLNLNVKLFDSKNLFSFENSLVFPFYPEFVTISPSISNSNQILLYKSKPHTQIHIKHGLSEIIFSNSDFIRIRKVSTHLDTSTFEIQVIDLENSLTDSIIFKSPSTGQEVCKFFIFFFIFY